MQATDMRRSFDGLSAPVRNHLGRDPLDGSGFLFVNRRRTQLKVLYFDGDGFCVWSKRLEQGRFAVQPGLRPGAIALSGTGFQALLEGLQFEVKKRSKRWSREAHGSRISL
jgi:transposase